MKAKVPRLKESQKAIRELNSVAELQSGRSQDRGGIKGIWPYGPLYRTHTDLPATILFPVTGSFLDEGIGGGESPCLQIFCL
jgi:hypothetical protein